MKKFLQFDITAGKCLVGLDAIANIQPGSTSTLFIYYVGNSSLKTTITFTADSTYATHYAIMQAVSDALSAASAGPSMIYQVPALPIVPGGSSPNTVTTITYA